ncbi:MAG: PilN domain-containing protein [Betaproteobacteria bacterium]|nr:PilN domain-containing protein [Betaproteobacteria bacterium]
MVALLSIAVVATWLALRESDHAARTERARSQLLAARASLARAPSRTDQEDQKRWDVLKAERDFAWEPLFQAIERTIGNDIELLELQPDKNNHRVMLRGEAKDQEALISFLASLSRQAALANVHLVSQQSASHGELETIAFDIKATLSQPVTQQRLVK